MKSEIKIPAEVYWVFVCSLQPVGLKTYNECQEIIKKYPEWFPWETKYNSIPKEVHEVHFKELYPDWDKPIVWGKGLYSESKPIEYPSKDPLGDMKRYFENLEKEQEKEYEEAKVENKRVRKIWNKHYKKYGLEYRK